MVRRTVDIVDSRRRPVVLAALIALTAGLALHALHTGLGIGGGTITAIVDDYLYNAVIVGGAALCLARGVLVRRERWAWVFFALGIISFGIGEIIGTVVDVDEIEVPAPSDYFWLASYGLLYVGLILLVRARVRRFYRGMWIDGLIGACGVASIVAAVLYDPIVEYSTAPELTDTEIILNLAYPFGDLVLLGFVAFALTLTGWRASGGWALIALALAAAATADVFFVYQNSIDEFVDGTVVDTIYLITPVALAWAAWRPPSERKPAGADGWRLVAVPAIFSIAAFVVPLYAEFVDVTGIARWLSRITLGLVIIRMILMFFENLKMVESSRTEALTDGLTKLGNRRKLMEDLDERLAAGRDSEPCALALFDLDGFKQYNDSYGHPAGDALLQRLGDTLQRSAGLYDGLAYRMGGDEFCVLVPAGTHKPETAIAAAAEALSEQGEGFNVASSFGSVMLPQEAVSAARALQLSDRRMYSHKDSRRTRLDRQTTDVLLQVLREREPDLGEHLDGTAALAKSVAHRLDLAPEQVDEVTRAAELHDVGKMAIPEAILHKPRPLDEVEWHYIRQHTVIGERILSAAPAMIPVARLVRASHERWDGKGYPDGLAGDEIPVGARIIAVCDAYDAMTSQRAYRSPVSDVAAVAELRRAAGTQFDPEVVQACAAELGFGRDDAADDGAAPAGRGSGHGAGGRLRSTLRRRGR